MNTSQIVLINQQQQSAVEIKTQNIFFGEVSLYKSHWHCLAPPAEYLLHYPLLKLLVTFYNVDRLELVFFNVNCYVNGILIIAYYVFVMEQNYRAIKLICSRVIHESEIVC
jgi:hypothetical protein